ncbi:MAG: helix-hairpin-helix domain-containing protein [Eubacterium sp.]|nr:helix-hairpin-helix domain-containing protein [Eubacterium sp.]
MVDIEKENKKASTLVLMGVAFVILGLVIGFVSLSQPKISVETDEPEYSSTMYSSYSDETTVEAENTVSSSQIQSSANIDNTTKKTTTKAASPSVSYPLNLNTCTAAELMTIDMIGQTRANAIIAYRDYLGGYTSVEQLRNISGIGDSVYAAIEPYVTV